MSTLKSLKHPGVKKILYCWFLRMRGRNWAVSGLKAKDMEKHSQLKEKEFGCNASDGLLQRFSFFKVSGEKLLSQSELLDPFKLKLKQ